MNKRIIASIGGFLAMLTGIPASVPAELSTLTVLTSNFKNEKGLAVVELFRRGDAMPEKPFLKSNGKIENGNASIVFHDIPYGEYAAILFHDENANSVLDHKWGLPNEPMGFSNNWTLSLFSGMPKFSKLMFRFTKENPEISIRISSGN